MFEISSDPPHPGAFFIGIAKTVPIIYDMNLIQRQFSQTFCARTIGMSGCHGFCCSDTQRFCKFLKLVFRMKSFAHICQQSKTDNHSHDSNDVLEPECIRPYCTRVQKTCDLADMIEPRADIEWKMSSSSVKASMVMMVSLPSRVMTIVPVSLL